MNDVIAVFNAGSSSLKFSLFDYTTLESLYQGKVDNIPTQPVFSIEDTHGTNIAQQSLSRKGHDAALHAVLGWITSLENTLQLKIAGHRVVHGKDFPAPVRITPDIMTMLGKWIPLAPLHQPHNLRIIDALTAAYPQLPQIACFDTAFHHTQPRLSRMFALPRQYYDEGIQRYGFHGLSYEYIASELPKCIGNKASGKVIVAHLGNGASLCAMQGLKSHATSMGFSTLDGLMMGTRCGTLDPGVLLYLQQEKKLSLEQVERLLFYESGLKGVSGISHDMRTLLVSDAPEAKEAIALYCATAARHIAALAANMGGVDALVFTAGIGENQPTIRQSICDHLAWAGLQIDTQKNIRNHDAIYAKQSRMEAWVIPTNEELMIARHCRQLKQ